MLPFLVSFQIKFTMIENNLQKTNNVLDANS